MSKRSSAPVLELLRITRTLQLLELKYKFALEDGRVCDQEVFLKKAKRLGERAGYLKAIITHQAKMERMRKETENVSSNSSDRDDS